MDEAKSGKNSVLSQVAERMNALSPEQIEEKYNIIENKLFEFANFLESHQVFLYPPGSKEIPTENIIRKAMEIEKSIILPVFTDVKNTFLLYKISHFDKDLVSNAHDMLEPNPERCKKIALDDVDIAIIPGLAFDDKGGRMGFGNNYYSKLITKLPETCRKVALAYEEQIVDQIQMESRKYTVDIIITDTRVIYKI
ncbi:5-formyltetrahydrofolate cyclo-ligase [Desulfobacter hydrogenophilus]|uniref:5-formyltetrahydrofolate cyclo-ligase n=1 Tax=Desulfobacter hydrogenophilus TaxID=2291 RepID=A0A328FCQ0_9BACT|nr:5-formyltetrahydrofolate cyclo-ligase [Desulfobacter hydrogenophilus]NDY71700.1 5-formyltetrahydrofolate cyclo-ligase [Desulfobacter hydrogenophilus]QBH13211.1 5-formyltetrahydrofolate cyclo-ligase [Desulfobacter hydrogenophilus]RAM02368.1 5-formyltetrahydrofolate cyclo-ligase [Desulfobacter hydrogenophilus]